MVGHTAHLNDCRTQTADNSSDVGKEAGQVSLAHFHARTLNVEDEVNVDFRQ